ncbi:MAG: cAMP-binding protein, partial [SAR116 cluster bacterium]|nr:cAMP-binding protein [SAR116 cluster bacterium]
MNKKPTFITKKYSQGDVIYSYNDKSEYVYLIESGQVKIITKQGLELGILNEGEIFGEIGHIIDSSRTVTVIAQTNSII